jgi:acylphosphatase
MAKEQRTVSYSGTVQGVGFRYTACRVAQRYDVTGYVRNVSDGRVECLVEGESAEIGAFLAELAEHMRGYIDGQEQRQAPYTGLHKHFGVRY